MPGAPVFFLCSPFLLLTISHPPGVRFLFPPLTMCIVSQIPPLLHGLTFFLKYAFFMNKMKPFLTPTDFANILPPRLCRYLPPFRRPTYVMDYPLVPPLFLPLEPSTRCGSQLAVGPSLPNDLLPCFKLKLADSLRIQFTTCFTFISFQFFYNVYAQPESWRFRTVF